MKKKVTIHEFDPVIYPYKIWVVVDRKPSSISEMFYEYDGSEILSWDNTSHLDAMAMSVMKKDNSSYGCACLVVNSGEILFSDQKMLEK